MVVSGGPCDTAHPATPHYDGRVARARSHHANPKGVEADRHILGPERAIGESDLVRASERGWATLQGAGGSCVPVAARPSLDRNAIVTRGDVVVPDQK